MKKIIFLLSLFFTSFVIQAQSNGLEAIFRKSDLRVFGGVLIGGVSPLPIPSEIREIKSYSPEFNGMLGASLTYWRNDQYGFNLGLRIENKGMKSSAQVKGYKTEIVNGEDKVAGYWTGQVDTRVKITYLTLPVFLDYKLSETWILQAGVYFSYQLTGDFEGEVSKGYLREGTPIGQKIEFKNEQYASYNFSDNLAGVAYGLQIGFQWKAIDKLHMLSQLTWGLNDIFKSDFETISFAMYPIYLSIGAVYQF